jgi:hypothetical protein
MLSEQVQRPTEGFRGENQKEDGNKKSRPKAAFQVSSS